MAETEERTSHSSGVKKVEVSKALFWRSWRSRWLLFPPAAGTGKQPPSAAGWLGAVGSLAGSLQSWAPQVQLANECSIMMFCMLHFQSARQTIANYNPYERIILLAACGKAC